MDGKDQCHKSYRHLSGSEVLCTFAVKSVEVEGLPTARGGLAVPVPALPGSSSGAELQERLPWNPQLLLGDGEAPKLAVTCKFRPPRWSGICEVCRRFCFVVFFLSLNYCSI